MAFDKLKANIDRFLQKLRKDIPVWEATLQTKSREFSDKSNTKLLHWLDEFEEKTDPARDFLADTSAQNTQGAHFFAHLVLWVILCFFIIAITWANFAVLDEVTVGEGKIIPATQVQVIQNLEGGIVKKILVKEGDIVQANQVLMQLDDTHFDSDYQTTQMKALALEAKNARLTAVITNQPFVVSDELKAKAPDLVEHERQLYVSQENEQKQLQEAYLLSKKEYDLTKPLIATGAASDVEVLRLERQMSDAQEQIDNFQSKALQDLNTAKGDLLGVNASLASFEDRVARTTIRSPVKGIVKQIKLTTVGGVSQPGMDLMEIVPLDDTLLVEAQIKPRDVGFLHVGQPATVKISAYDFSIYGGLKGKVEQISADTITNPKGESFYLVHVRTEKNYLRTKKNPLYIIPGMMASVDILTGHKSVLDYLLKPIIKAKKEALRER